MAAKPDTNDEFFETPDGREVFVVARFGCGCMHLIIEHRYEYFMCVLHTRFRTAEGKLIPWQS